MARLTRAQRHALQSLPSRNDEEARLLAHVLADETGPYDDATAPTDGSASDDLDARLRRRGLRRPVWIDPDGRPHVPSIEDLRASLPSAPQVITIMVAAVVLAGLAGLIVWLFLDALPW